MAVARSHAGFGLLVAALLVACTGAEDSLTVFAASSLSAALPDALPEPSYTFAGSSGLVDQVAGGAPADVLLTADQRTMDRAVAEGLVVGEPLMFATNAVVLVAPADNPAHVTGFDESLTGTRLVVCAPEVPCGAAARAVAELNDISLTPVSETQDVTGVMGLVTSGEADAGIVYSTNAAEAGESVVSFPIPGAEEGPNTYWAAVVAGSDQPEDAQEFLDQLLDEAAQDVLRDHGFGAP